MQDALVLRDIHQPPAPPWWPPAPGWWLLAVLLLLLVGVVAWLAARRRRRRRLAAAVFDDALAAAPTPTGEVAAMSELLRRAARRRDPAADRLHGEAWLEFLDGAVADRKRRHGRPPADPGADAHRFSQGAGRLLLEGGYRRDVDPRQVAELKPLARARFLEWMAK